MMRAIDNNTLKSGDSFGDLRSCVFWNNAVQSPLIWAYLDKGKLNQNGTNGVRITR